MEQVHGAAATDLPDKKRKGAIYVLSIRMEILFSPLELGIRCF